MEDESSEGKIYEQVGIVMSHRTLKLLAEVLQATISQYERDTGNKIFFDPKKLDALRAKLNPSSNDSQPPS